MAYTQSPVCGATRTSLHTGCTIERTGVQTKPLTDSVNSLDLELFQDKIDPLVSLDKILVEDDGYVSEYYGKWHIPSRFYDRRDGNSRVVKANTFDYSGGVFYFEDVLWQRMLRKYVAYFNARGLIKRTYAPGQQQNSYSEYPYTPIRLDSRYGLPTNTPLNRSDSFKSSENSQMGKSSLGKAYYASFLNHDVALRALNRLAFQDTRFLLTISYHHPHPPFIATTEYLSYYWDSRQNLFTSPSIGYRSNKSNPYFASMPQQLLLDAGFCNLKIIKEWTAVYYAMIEEIDVTNWVLLSTPSWCLPRMTVKCWGRTANEVNLTSTKSQSECHSS
jgi:arylsulfatase A-like enzyme